MQAQTMDLSEAQASDYNRGNKGSGHKTSFLLSIVVVAAAAAKTHKVPSSCFAEEGNTVILSLLRKSYSSQVNFLPIPLTFQERARGPWKGSGGDLRAQCALSSAEVFLEQAALFTRKPVP